MEQTGLPRGLQLVVGQPGSPVDATSLLVTLLFVLQPIPQALPVDLFHRHHFLPVATSVDLLQRQLTYCGTKQISGIVIYH